MVQFVPRKLVVCLLVSVFLLGSGLFFSVQADENFFTALHTTYTTTNSGQTMVEHRITLKNKTPTVYAKQYGLKLSSPNLENVKVTSNGAVIPAEIVSTDNQTSVGITFTDQLVGEGKSRDIAISYISTDVAVISGQVLEIIVPKLGNATQYDDYTVTLHTPIKYGEPSRVTPAPITQEKNGAVLTSVFKPRGGESVSALFGKTQLFNLNLRYHLPNTTAQTGIAQVALPPDTSYQKIHYHSIDPMPTDFERDRDGNWIATYRVPAESTTLVTVAATAFVTDSANPDIPVLAPYQQLTQSQAFWQSKERVIADLAQQYPTPEQIYNYVIDTLSYDYSALDREVVRLGAVEALEKPNQAACQEFTDVFISMARAAGIPARRLTGYAYTQNSVLKPLSLVQDILHAWPEYYDQDLQQWRQIDPTWGDTTGGVNYFNQFDLNHVVFAINGESSSTPYPAGSYKQANTNTKDVEVTFGGEFPEVSPEVDVQIVPQTIVGVPIPGHYQLRLTNQTGQAWYNWQLQLTSTGPQVTLDDSPTLLAVLPYQTVTVPFHASTTSFWQTAPVQLQLDIVHDQQTLISQQFSANSVIASGRVFVYLTNPILLAAVGASCILLTLLAGSLLVRRSRR